MRKIKSLSLNGSNMKTIKESYIYPCIDHCTFISLFFHKFAYDALGTWEKFKLLDLYWDSFVVSSNIWKNYTEYRLQIGPTEQYERLTCSSLSLPSSSKPQKFKL